MKKPRAFQRSAFFPIKLEMGVILGKGVNPVLFIRTPLALPGLMSTNNGHFGKKKTCPRSPFSKKT